MKTKSHGEIMYVDFIDGKPHSVITTESEWDFAWCKRDSELLFYNSGGGIRPGAERVLPNWCNPQGASFWAADSVRLRIQREWNRETKAYDVDEEATPEAIARHGLVRLASLINDPFEDATEAYHGIGYCSVCEDSFDDESTCDHIWRGSQGEKTGPGSDDGIESLKDGFLRFCAIAGITRNLRKGLVPFDIKLRGLHATGGLGPSFVDLYVGKKHLGDIAQKLDRYSGNTFALDEELRDAAHLLFALDDKTSEANALIKAWLDEAVVVQDARRASGELVYIVADDYDYAADKLHEDERRTYLDANNGVGTVFATAKQARAKRMSWAEASALIKRLNGNSFRKDYFVRHLRKKTKA